jgi:hypothetical protein
MGFNQETLEMEDFCILEYCISMSLRDRRTNFRWVMVTVYGPVDHNKTKDFWLN